MNILQVNKYYHPEVGGIERVVQNISEGLSDNHNIKVLSSTKRGFGYERQHNGVNIRKVTSLGEVMSVPMTPTFPIHLQNESKDTDIVHHHLPNPISTVSHTLAKNRNHVVIATYHSDIVRQSKGLKLYRPILQRFLRKVDHILVTSPRLIDHSSELEPHVNKCEVVPLSVDINSIDAENASPLDIQVEGPIVLFVGRLVYYKGIEYLIDAMTEIDATLLIVGNGELRSELEGRIQKKNLKDKIRFLGHVSDTTLASAYRTADIFALPSVESSEAFGIVQLEAMAREIPVVNTSLPTGVPWVSRDEETGITVPPRNSSALADAINTLIENDQLQEKYGEQARERVEKLFTREKMLDQIQTIYRRVAEESMT